MSRWSQTPNDSTFLSCTISAASDLIEICECGLEIKVWTHSGTDEHCDDRCVSINCMFVSSPHYKPSRLLLFPSLSDLSYKLTEPSRFKEEKDLLRISIHLPERKHAERFNELSHSQLHSLSSEGENFNVINRSEDSSQKTCGKTSNV